MVCHGCLEVCSRNRSDTQITLRCSILALLHEECVSCHGFIHRHYFFFNLFFLSVFSRLYLFLQSFRSSKSYRPVRGFLGSSVISVLGIEVFLEERIVQRAVALQASLAEQTPTVYLIPWFSLLQDKQTVKKRGQHYNHVFLFQDIQQGHEV